MVARNAVPWGKPGDSDPDAYAYQDRWRLLTRALDMGITGDYGASANRPWRAYCTGTDAVLRVATVDSQAVIEGVHVQIPGEPIVTYDLAALGSLPTSGQARVDALVWRYDPTAQDVILALVTGVPASGTEDTVTARPTLTRDDDPDGVWEEPVAWVTRRGGQPLSSAYIVRADRYVSPLAYIDTGWSVSEMVAPIGQVVVRRAGAAVDLHVRGRNTSGAGGVWLGVTDPAWTTSGWTNATGVTGNPSWRVAGGRLQAIGTLARVGSPAPAFSSTAVSLLGTLNASLVPGLNGTRYVPVATNGAASARISVVPLSDGRAQLEAQCPAGTTALVLDALNVPLG